MVGTIDAIEAKPQLGVVIPRRGDMEGTSIRASWILGGDVWWADGNRVLHVRILRNAVALQLPMSWNLNLGPPLVRHGLGLRGL